MLLSRLLNIHGKLVCRLVAYEFLNSMFTFFLLQLHAGGVVNVNGRKLCPRIILMTDGKPTDENGRETEQVRKYECVR